MKAASVVSRCSGATFTASTSITGTTSEARGSPAPKMPSPHRASRAIEQQLSPRPLKLLRPELQPASVSRTSMQVRNVRQYRVSSKAGDGIAQGHRKEPTIADEDRVSRLREPSFIWENSCPPVTPHLERFGRRGRSSLGRACKKV